MVQGNRPTRVLLVMRCVLGGGLGVGVVTGSPWDFLYGIA